MVEYRDKIRNDLKQMRQKINSMIFPIILENILQLAAGIVSMGMIGRISTTSVAALGICTLLTGITWNLFKGISVGTTVLIAGAFGSQDMDKLKAVAQQALVSMIVSAILVQLIVYGNARGLLLLFDPQPNILADAIRYLKIIVFGFPFMAIMLCVTGILQGMGDARTPMFLALIMNLTNILLGYLFIFGGLGIEAMGLQGAARALVAAQGTGAFFGLVVLFYRKRIFHDMPKHSFFKPDFSVIREIFRLGIPSSLEGAFWQLSSIIISRVILSFGEIPFAAYQFGIQAEAIAEMPALGFGIAATTFTSQSLGAMNKEQGKRYLWEIGKGAMLVISIGAAALLLFPYSIMRLFTDQAEIIALGVIYLRLVALVQFPQNIQRVFSGALVGAGFTRIPMMITGTGIWLFRIPVCLILTGYFNADIVVVWIVICADQVLRFFLSLTVFKRKRIFHT